MPTHSRTRSWPGILFGVLAILLAMGNSWLGIYPFGSAVWIRPLVGLIGIIGAICLFWGNGWWRILLPVWCGLQTWVIAIDVSREWFYQGIMLGWSHVRTVKNNEMLVTYSARGVNFAGLILLGILLIIAWLRWHPAVRYRIRGKSLVLLLIMVVVIAMSAGITQWRDRAATFVLDLDLPRVPIYYKDQMLGRTPLRITTDLIQRYNLPLDTAQFLTFFDWGWADSMILSDGKTKLPLYAGVPWPFEAYIDTFDSPWGTRCRFHVGGEHANRRYGFVYPKAALRDEPILTIQLLDPQPIVAGAPLRLRCMLNNPTSNSYHGRQANIRRLCFSYESRQQSTVAPPPGFRREVTMPPTWNDLPSGVTLTADVEFDAPPNAGDYELFCTWFLYTPEKNSNTGVVSNYSNMLWLQVK